MTGLSRTLFAAQALLADGWADNVLFEIAANGDIAKLSANSDAGEAERAAGPVLPGMINLHSHAFQRALAGAAERAGPGEDSFWTWREVMYRFVSQLTPGHLEAVALQLYIEMLKQGYTAVGEFHYVHHSPDGVPYDNIAEMSERVIAAARKAGLAISHLPVLYAYGGFGGAPLGAAQQRFQNDPDSLLSIVATLNKRYADDPDVRIGLAPHSLRAVTQDSLTAVVNGLRSSDPEAPIHLHIAEQEKEVKDCAAWSGKRPVEWLFEHFPPDPHWCLIHATHMTAGETRLLAKSGAVAGLCPTTEANLGDGLFPYEEFVEAGGRFGIGSDSHVSVSPVEELRWLEYGQRLAKQQRNIAATQERPSVGANLWKAACSGGAQAVARRGGSLAVGMRADLIVLDGDHVNVAGRRGDEILDSLIFAGNDRLVRDVMVAGHWCVQEGVHPLEQQAAGGYRKAVAELLN